MAQHGCPHRLPPVHSLLLLQPEIIRYPYSWIHRMLPAQDRDTRWPGFLLYRNWASMGTRCSQPCCSELGVGRGQLVARSGTSTWAPRFSSPGAGPVYFYPSPSPWQCQAAPSL